MINDTILAACIVAASNSNPGDLIAEAYVIYDAIMHERMLRHAAASELAA
jgi:hypothetical protein